MENFKKTISKNGISFVKLFLIGLVTINLCSCGKGGIFGGGGPSITTADPCEDKLDKPKNLTGTWSHVSQNGDKIVFIGALGGSNIGTYSSTSPDLGCQGTYTLYDNIGQTSSDMCGVVVIELIPDICSFSNTCNSCQYSKIQLGISKFDEHNLEFTNTTVSSNNYVYSFLK